MHNMVKDLGFKAHPWRDKRVVDHCKQMSKPDGNIIFDARVASVLRSQGFEWVESPRSVYDPDQLYAALAKYAPTREPEIRIDQHVKSGIALAYKVFAKPEDESHLQVLSLVEDDVRTMTSNPTGSSGLTAFGVKKREAIPLALDSATRIVQGKKVPEPCISFKRTQFHNKTRLIWGYPYSMTVLEGLFARPLIDRFKGSYGPMAFGLTSGCLGARLRSSAAWYKYAYSLDMSSFDSSINSKLIDVAFSILATWFDMDEVEPISQIRHGEIFSRVKKYFIRTPIVMPDQQLYVGKNHGVPSGSYFTQLVDSIVNVIFCGAISSKFHLDVDSNHLYVLGDDLLLWSNRLCDLGCISRYALKAMGLNVHGSEKSRIMKYDEPIHFLGRVWIDGFPTTGEQEILSRMVYPERWRPYSNDSDVAEAEVKILFLSIAATYRDGWRMARRCYFETDSRYRMPQLVERLPQGLTDNDVDRDGVRQHTLTGSQLYKLKYVFDRTLKTTVATQYWL